MIRRMVIPDSSGKKPSCQMEGKDKGMRVDVEAICFNFVCEL